MPKFKFETHALTRKDYNNAIKKLEEITGLKFIYEDQFRRLKYIKKYSEHEYKDKLSGLEDFCMREFHGKYPKVANLFSYMQFINYYGQFSPMMIIRVSEIGVYCLINNINFPKEISEEDIKLVRQELNTTMGIEFTYQDNELVSDQVNENYYFECDFLETRNSNINQEKTLSILMPKLNIHYFAREIKKALYRENHYKSLIKFNTRFPSEIVEKIFEYIEYRELPKTLIYSKGFQKMVEKQRQDKIESSSKTM